MPIKTNDGGVIRTLGTISANDSGVVRNMGTVSANDGGVIRTVHSANKVEITGITPLVAAEDHIVIVNSGTFKLTAPAGTRIIVASGGAGDYGGHVAEYTLTAAVKNAQCTATVAATRSRNGNDSKLVIAGVTYSSGNVIQVILSKWGPIGGNGGKNDPTYGQNRGPTGAGGGAGRAQGSDGYVYRDGQQGGNNGGYGNFGGNGWGYPNYNSPATPGKYGAPCNGIADDEYSHRLYPSGGGGYAAGAGYGDYDANPADEDNPNYSGGEPGPGIIVIEWD